MDDLAAIEESADFFLAKTIRSMEERLNDTVTHEKHDALNTGDHLETGNVYIPLKVNQVLHVNNINGSDVNKTDQFCSGISDAQVRVLRAKLRIMQEELDQLSSEYYKKVL